MSRSSIPRLARVRDSHQTKRRRTAAQKKQASAERVALRRAKQDLNANNKGDQHPPQAMGGLPVYPSSAETPQVWWQCEFCEHAVRYVDFPKNPEAMYRARKVHLSQAHGIDKPPCLNKRSNLSTVPNRVNEASEAFDIRWKAVWQERAKDGKVVMTLTAKCTLGGSTSAKMGTNGVAPFTSVDSASYSSAEIT